MGMDVRNNEARSRFELVQDERVVAVADYVVRGDVVVFPHTEVVPELRGRGLGERLVRAALDDVRRTGRTIVPACWFVAEFVERNPEYGDLLAA
jgi:predicted GNAT family acetyltransferase